MRDFVSLKDITSDGLSLKNYIFKVQKMSENRECEKDEKVEKLQDIENKAYFVSIRRLEQQLFKGKACTAFLIIDKTMQVKSKLLHM